MIDGAELGGQIAPWMFAVTNQQLGRIAGRAGEQPAAPAEIDDHPIGVDDRPADVAGEGGPEYVVRVDRHPGRRLASSGREIVGRTEQFGEQIVGAGKDR